MSNEFKGTQGPWEVDGVEIRASASHRSERLCEMAPGFLKADAQLIAAAPDMLIALLQIEQWWLESGRYSFYGAPAAMFSVRAAIHKATSISN